LWRADPGHAAAFRVLAKSLRLGGDLAALTELTMLRAARTQVPEERAVAWSLFERWREARSLDGLEAYSPRTFAVRLVGRPPEAVRGVNVSPALLPFLGVAPVAGRVPDGESGRLTAVVSARFVKNRYSGAADAVGQSLRLDGQEAVIVGVLPAEFRFFNSAWQIFVPFPASTADQRQAVSVVARLRAGVDPRQALGELDNLATRQAATAAARGPAAACRCRHSRCRSPARPCSTRPAHRLRPPEPGSRPSSA
jgi:hypothetical protein